MVNRWNRAMSRPSSIFMRAPPTLLRCHFSSGFRTSNRPFCDGHHIDGAAGANLSLAAANGLVGNSLARRWAAQGRAHRLIPQAAQLAFAVRLPNRNLIFEKTHIANAAASAAPNTHKR